MRDLAPPLGGLLGFPHFPVPDGETVETWLRKACRGGPGAALRRDHARSSRSGSDYELGVIISMG